MDYLAQRNAQALAGVGGGATWLPWAHGRVPGSYMHGAGQPQLHPAQAMTIAQQNGMPAGNGDCAPCAQMPGGGGAADLAKQIAWLLKGGFQGEGLGSCGPYPNPAIPVGADGCPSGTVQCLQPLSVTSPANVVSGTSALITVTPRSQAVAREFLYGGVAGDFTIDSVVVNGTDYLNGAILADRYLPVVDNRAIDWGPAFTSTTPMLITVTKITAGDATFRGVLDASVDR